ncbi:collagen-like protein [Paenibacillus sp. GCM10027628]|uniref:collagen-like protein n=1 Tax=Paenibacillus sp. GCM10027628 TaxID=3273413 RepID=UPI003634D3F0
MPAYDPRSFGGGGFPGLGGFPGGGGMPGFGQPGMAPGFPGFPGFPQPGGPQPGFPQPGPSMPGGAQPGSAQAPTSPPPSYTPQKPFKPAGAVFAVDPGAIGGCLFRFTYVWLSNGQQFWYFPIFVGSTSIAGFRWTGFTWMYFGIDLRFIDSFTC